MTHYLRTKRNETIVECEVSIDDLSSAIEIVEYSLLLLGQDKPNIFIYDFDEILNIRREWFEREMDSGDWGSINEFVSAKYGMMAKKHDLNYITG